jgi:ABC-2 type transport system permease protein
MRTIYQLLAFVRRDWTAARSSTFSLAWQGMTILFATPTLYYIGRLVRPGTPSLAPYGGDYFTFAILGIAFSSFLASVMGSCAAAVRQEQLGGTLDTLLTMPASLATLALGASLWPLLLMAVQSLLYLGVGMALFHINFAHANVAGTVVIVALMTTVTGAFGVLAAAFVLLFRRADPLTGVVAGVGAVLAGVFYPVDILPPRARALSELVPLTPALHGLRLAVMRGAGFDVLEPSILVLLGWCLLAVPLAVVVAKAALYEARRSGVISWYG